MKILVPLDFSDNALQALRYAIALAHQWKTDGRLGVNPELIIFHAFHLPVGGDATFFIDDTMLKREDQHVLNKIKHILSKLPEIQTLSYKVITKMILPYDGIIEVVKEEKVQLVVMGKYGTDIALSKWLGNTTLKIMKHISCPVLAVPQSCETFHPRQVIFATDLKRCEENASLSLFKELILMWKAKLQIIHVHPQPSKIEVTQAEEAWSLEYFFRDVPHSYTFQQDKKPVQGIEHYLHEHSADLLAIIPRKHSVFENLFHSSVSKQLASHTSIPLFSIYNASAS